jgi:hypothetical protein
MADRKISDLTALTTPASGDFLPIVDISEAAAATKNKRITIEELMRGMPDGTAAAPSIAFENDPNTGIYSPGADQVALATAGTGRLFVNSSGQVGVGTSSPGAKLDVVSIPINVNQSAVSARFGTGSDTYDLRIENNTDVLGNPFVVIKGPDGGLMYTSFQQGGVERLRVDSSGRLLVGTSSARSLYGQTGVIQTEGIGYASSGINIILNNNSAAGPLLQLAKSRGTANGSSTIVQSGDTLGSIYFCGADGSDLDTPGGGIACEVDGAPGANDMPGRLVFSTTADGAATPTERMRIDASGRFFVGTTATQPNPGFVVSPTGFNKIGNNAGSDGWGFYDFLRSGVSIGSITQTGTTGVAYNTSSDYRLKENVTPVTDSITRLQQLNPSRFNFIADPDRIVDGFIAHEAQAVVPECVTGEKDAVDNDGNPVYQGIDQSKMVPLAVAAIQECVKRIEALEAELALLKSGN